MMKINRRGSSSDRGSRSIDINKPKIEWNQKLNTMQFRQLQIRDFATKSLHDYTIDISLAEIREIIRILGDEIVNESPDAISAAFSPCLRELIRIEKACIGDIGISQGAD